MIIKELKINNTDFCLTSVIYAMHKEKKDIYINKVLDNYGKMYKSTDKKTILQKIKWLNTNGYIKYYYKDSKYGHILTYIKVTDKFLMLHKLSLLVALLRKDEKTFYENAEQTLEKIITYLRRVKQDGK
jgi:hypothetical protein